MNILNVMSISANTLDVLFRVSTHEWDKKSLIRMGIISTAFLGSTILLSKMHNNTSDDESAEECKEGMIDE